MLSVIIPTFNEEQKIETALKSVAFADEIIVIDSHSTDATCAIAKLYGAKVILHDFDTHAKQKNRAIDNALNNWVLILDADEALTSELEEEVKTAIDNSQFDAFWVYRKNFFMGRHMKYSGLKNDKVIRLINKDKCRYNHKFIHEEIELKGLKVGVLKHKLLHDTYKTFGAFMEKMTFYGRQQSKDYSRVAPNAYHFLIKPFFRFANHFIWKLGFLDGFEGLVYAYCNAHAVFSRYFYLKQKKEIDG